MIATSTRPQTAKGFTEPRNLPKYLQDHGRFCLWKYTQDDKGKWTKPPYKACFPASQASKNNPADFTDMATALSYSAGYDGLGVHIGFSDDVSAIDIDHCIDEAGNLSMLAQSVVDLMDTYTERSPSGQGIRIFFRIAPGFVYDRESYLIKNSKATDPREEWPQPQGLEVYVANPDNNYYLTATGDPLRAVDVQERTQQLSQVLKRYMARPVDTMATKRTAQPVGASLGLSDRELIDKAQGAENGAKFKALWNGDWQGAGYGSQSEADLALCSMLAYWTGRDNTRIDNLFRESGLYRGKWDERHGPNTYGEATVIKAVERCNNVYSPRTFDAPPPPEPPAYMVQQTEAQRKPEQESANTHELQYKPAGRDLTDAGNAELFARMHMDELRYCDALGWLNWTGKHWDLDNHAAARKALDFSMEMLKEAAAYFSDATGGGEENPAAKQYLNHAMKLRSANAQKNMVELAKARLAIKAQELDADPEILNTEAGIINLRTGQTMPHDPTKFCTKLTPVAPSINGVEKWEAFLDLVTCGDSDLKKYLRRVAGMAIVGKVYEEGLQITIGGGRNGKSTFYGALSKVLGDYAGTIDPDVLIARKHESRFELAPLRGKRLVVCSELEEGQRLSIKALKRIASKDDINVERKFKDQEQVAPTHHLILHTNVLPIVGDANDNATWRRLTVIPFNAVMPSGNKDIKAYDDILVKDAGGAILQWMIDGAREYLAAGGSLGELPKIVKEATNQYRESEDWLQPFIDECCIFEQKSATQAVELYNTYQEHATRRGDRYIRKGREFYDALTKTFTARGLICKKPGNKVTWYGVRVRVVASTHMSANYNNNYEDTGY